MTESRLLNITIPQMLELCHDAPDWELEILETAARSSDPLLALFYGSDLLCVGGFSPKTILSDEAYIWLCSTHAVERHKLVFGRWAKKLIAMGHTRYPRLVGHCPKRSVGWLRQLGARFGEVDELVEFEIVRGHV